MADLIRAIVYIDAALQLFQLMDEDYFVQIADGDLERAKDELRSQGEPQDQEEDELSNPGCYIKGEMHRSEMSQAACILAWDNHEIYLVAHTGFEPVISALRGRCPRPLDECAMP